MLNVAAGTELTLLGPDGEIVANEVADDDGTALFRELPAGPGYALEAGPYGRFAEITVLDADDTPPTWFYENQDLTEGYNYIETRDGTTLAAWVTLPGAIENGPYPTLVEYSGYDEANPTGSQPARILGPPLGYATVQVNVRGTGCSGGAYDPFSIVEAYDGYDVIEVVAAQGWTLPTVGMFGLSYPGIMQFHVARTQPPHLAAIAPLSVIDRLDSVLTPGGVPNDGFALDWTEGVSTEAAALGQGWEEGRIAAGDEICGPNQALRGHLNDALDRSRAASDGSRSNDEPSSQEATANLIAERSPETFAGEIKVPTFLAGAWQDEQTGGRFPSLIDELAASTTLLRVTMYNGLHADGFAPAVLSRLKEFYDLTVAQVVPSTTLSQRALASLLSNQVYGTTIALDEDRFATFTTVQAAFEAYAAEQPIRILFESGGDPTLPGPPVPRFEVSFAQWPPSDASPSRWFLGPNATLTATPAGGTATPAGGTATQSSFRIDVTEGARTTIERPADLAKPSPPWRWSKPVEANAATFTSEPLDADVVVVGPVSADLTISVDAIDADLEATLSEVRPDGTEVYVQTGWLRLSRRTLADSATEFRPTPDPTAKPIPIAVGTPTPVRIEILPVAHAFRAGSRLRLTIDAPGGSRPSWTFDLVDESRAGGEPGTVVTVHHDSTNRSSLVLPIVAGVVPAPGLPAVCPGLRGQPCR